MVDLTRRSWENYDSDLLSLFNVRFPQTQPWTLCTLRKENKYRADLRLVEEKNKAAVTAQRSKAQDKHWERWDAFCVENGIYPLLRAWSDPIPVLQVYCDGRIAPRKKCVRSRTVEDALRVVGQTFARLGGPDFRKDFSGEIVFCIRRQLRAYKKEDAPPRDSSQCPSSSSFTF
jgi:hypothetical protein